MAKTLDLSRTIYELYARDPDIIGIMREAGCSEIVKPLMLKTAGRVMTIPKGAKMRGISLEEVLRVFRSNGYDIIDHQEEI